MKKVILKNSSMITGCGDTTEANIEALTGSFSPERLRLANFPAQKYLKDKRVLKVVGEGDRYGLAALEQLLNSDPSLKSQDPYTKGLYVGISPASPFCNENYFEAMRVSGDEGPKAFGLNYTMAHPTTLLTGLPNNVLCYGAIMLDAKGPNSNYTSMDVSGHVALMAAGSQVRNGLIDTGIAGGVASHKNPVIENMMRLNDLVADGQTAFPGASGTMLADGATFVTLVGSENVNQGIELVAWQRAAGSPNLFGEFEASPAAQISVLKRCMIEGSVTRDEIGAIFVTGSGISVLDGCEMAAIASVFADSNVMIIATSRITGNLMEAGGLFELPFFSVACANRGFPDPVIVSGKSFDPDLKPYALILRTSTFGDVTCLLIKWNG